MNMPRLTFSVTMAVAKYMTGKNPRGFVPRVLSHGYSAAITDPDGCVPLRRVQELAKGKCGLMLDRPAGLDAKKYLIGEYAGQAGREVYCSPCPVTQLAESAPFRDFVGIDFEWHGLFVGSPPLTNTNSMTINHLRAANELASMGIHCVFDSGGVVDEDTDAGKVFDMLCILKVPFWLEPTLPENGMPQIDSSQGVVSTSDRVDAMRADKDRKWYDEEWCAITGYDFVVWCIGGAEQRLARAKSELAAGLSVIVPLRQLSESDILELCRLAGLSESDTEVVL